MFPVRVVFAVIAICFGYDFIQSIICEVASIRGMERYLSNSPIQYWVLVVFEGGTSLTFAWFTIFPPKTEWGNIS